MNETIDKEIREAMVELVESQHADAKVYGWNVLSHKLADWPGLFRSDNSVHGWIIKRSAQSAERKNAQRDRVVLQYDIWAFYGFDSGKAGDNSDELFAVILTKTYNAFKAEPRLGFDDDVEYHELLQYVRLTTIDCGEETLHFAQGKLTVHLCC